mgnify:CR=1 FL=1
MTQADARIRHPDEGQWQAWLDGELPLPRRRELDRHWAECAACRTEVADLEAAWADLRQALTRVDLPAVARRRPRWARPRRAWWGVKVAAGLLVATTAVAAVLPGSPLRRWFDRAPMPVAHPAPVPSAPAPGRAAPARAVGVAVAPATGQVAVHLWPTEGSRLRVRVVFVDDGRVGVWARTLGVPSFATEAGRVDVRRLGSGTVTVEVPRRLHRFVLSVGERPYVIRDGNGLRIRPLLDTAAVSLELADSTVF